MRPQVWSSTSLDWQYCLVIAWPNQVPPGYWGEGVLFHASNFLIISASR